MSAAPALITKRCECGVEFQTSRDTDRCWRCHKKPRTHPCAGCGVTLYGRRRRCDSCDRRHRNEVKEADRMRERRCLYVAKSKATEKKLMPCRGCEKWVMQGTKCPSCGDSNA